MIIDSLPAEHFNNAILFNPSDRCHFFQRLLHLVCLSDRYALPPNLLNGINVAHSQNVALGNTIQLSLALARLFSGPEKGAGFLMPDRQAIVSLFSFLGGSFLGRIGDRYGAKSRGWLAFGTLLQAGLTMAASLCALRAHQSGLASSRAEPSWTDTLGFLALAFASASMGLQALLGTRIGAHFAT